MTTLRTKQQIAFDGVRATWNADAFTEILHHQVTTQFSMDGVIPTHGYVRRVTDTQVLKSAVAPVENVQKIQEKFVGAIDGVRLPWKQAYTA